jgi:nitrile hydratase subunit beta
VTLAVGTRVRVAPGDPGHHTRVPRYLRGHTGEVVAVLGEWALPDLSAQGTVRAEPCYAVRFAASELWGEGGHWVTADLWESYLEPR